MCPSISDKHALLERVLPLVEVSMTSNGILLSSERISERRFVPWDQGGRCRECKATEVEVDYMITKEGVTLWSTRLKGARFVPFDAVYDLSGHTFIRMRNRGRVYNIPHGLPETMCVQPLLPPPPPPPPQPAMQPAVPAPPQPATDFSALAAQLREPQGQQALPEGAVKQQVKQEDLGELVDLQHMMDSIAASTYGLEWASADSASSVSANHAVPTVESLNTLMEGNATAAAAAASGHEEATVEAAAGEQDRPNEGKKKKKH